MCLRRLLIFFVFSISKVCDLQILYLLNEVHSWLFYPLRMEWFSCLARLCINSTWKVRLISSVCFDIASYIAGDFRTFQSSLFFCLLSCLHDKLQDYVWTSSFFNDFQFGAGTNYARWQPTSSARRLKLSSNMHTASILFSPFQRVFIFLFVLIFLLNHCEMNHYKVVRNWVPDIQWFHTHLFTSEQFPPPISVITLPTSHSPSPSCLGGRYVKDYSCSGVFSLRCVSHSGTNGWESLTPVDQMPRLSYVALKSHLCFTMTWGCLLLPGV